MHRTFFYTQIKPSDFDNLKKFCVPFTKDIFGAKQEHIVAFQQPTQACTAALQFLNLISNRESDHVYKIVLINGDLDNDRPREEVIRMARSIHQQARPKNLYFTDEILNQIRTNDIVFEKKNELWIKELQKNANTYALTRFEGIELLVDPTDLFDFSQVDSYSHLDKVNPTKPAPIKDPFESSNTTLELGVPKKTEAPQATFTPPPVVLKPVSPRVSAPREMSTKSQFRSLMIIVVMLVLVSAGGFYMAKIKTDPPKNVYSYSTKTAPIPEVLSNTSTTPVAASSSPTAVQEAYVNIHSTPNNAEVWMNGEKISQKTPIDKWKVNPQENITIDVVKTGYQKVTKKVALESSETLTVLFQLNADKSNSKTKSVSKVKSTSLTKKK